MAQPHLRADGTIAAIAAPELAIDSLIDANQSLHGILIRDNGERLRQLAELFSGGRLRTHVTRVLPLEDHFEAFENVAQRLDLLFLRLCGIDELDDFLFGPRHLGAVPG